MRLNKLLIYLKKNIYFYLYYLVPFYFFYLKTSNLNNNIYLFSKSSKLFFLSYFLKNFQFLQINTVTDLVVVDNYSTKNRFKLIYNFLSTIYSFRVFLVCFLTNQNTVITSLINLFPGIN